MSDLDQHLPAIVSGDARAFGLWLAGAEQPIRLSLHRFAASVDTEAVLQECLLRIWQVAPRVESDGKPNSLLRLGIRIARNLAISEIRKSRSDAVDAPDLERLQAKMSQPDALHLPDPMLRQVIQTCRDGLPNKPAQALTARLESEGGEHDVAIAERIGMKKNTFLQNFTRARKFLAECLKKHGVNLELEMA